MRGQRVVEQGSGRAAGGDLRQRLLAGAPVAERQLLLAGVSTAVLAGLVLIGVGGLVGKVRLPPGMLLALVRHSIRPSERTALGMLRRLSVDVDRAQRRMGGRFGWPLRVIDDAGHFLALDQPAAFLRALSAALDRPRGAAG